MTPQSPNEALQPEAPPPPPPKPPGRRRPTLSALSGFISFLVIVALAALAGVAWGTAKLREPGPLAANKIVYIAPHTDLPDIIEKLDSEGVIDSPLALNLVLTAERKRSKVRAAEYLFKAHASLREVIDTLVSGKQYLHPFSVPEGLTSQQVVQRLRENDLLVGDVRDVPREGTLMPDTYKVYRGETRSAVVLRMQEGDKKMIDQIWARRAPDLPLHSPYEMVTLASIVEKETGKADERSRVAGVFINRLRKHIRLQSDPTIVYGLVAGQGTLGHSITRSELDRKTAYNTYQVDGLPPGPIDNPGRAALEAVANPSRTSDLYFVADGSGGHAFSGSIEEHNRNVQRWRQLERQAKDKDKADVDKLAPSAIGPATGKGGDQRSELDDAKVFGALPSGIVTASLGRRAQFADPTVNHGIDRLAATETAAEATGRAIAVEPAAYAAGADGLAFSLADVAEKPDGKPQLDGPITDAAATDPAAERGSKPTATPATATLAAATLAAHPVKTREARATALDAGASEHPDLFSDPVGGAPEPPMPTKVPPLHPKIYDASENTPLDPLRDHGYDLNTAKTIPADLAR